MNVGPCYSVVHPVLPVEEPGAEHPAEYERLFRPSHHWPGRLRRGVRLSKGRHWKDVRNEGRNLFHYPLMYVADRYVYLLKAAPVLYLGTYRHNHYRIGIGMFLSTGTGINIPSP